MVCEWSYRACGSQFWFAGVLKTHKRWYGWAENVKVENADPQTPARFVPQKGQTKGKIYSYSALSHTPLSTSYRNNLFDIGN